MADLDTWLAMVEAMDPEPQPLPGPASSSGQSATDSSNVGVVVSVQPSASKGSAPVEKKPDSDEATPKVFDPVAFVSEFNFDDETAKGILGSGGTWRYFWTPDIVEPTLPVRRSRGKQQRKSRTASLFSGTVAERAGHEATLIAEQCVYLRQ